MSAGPLHQPHPLRRPPSTARPATVGRGRPGRTASRRSAASRLRYGPQRVHGQPGAVEADDVAVVERTVAGTHAPARSAGVATVPGVGPVQVARGRAWPPSDRPRPSRSRRWSRRSGPPARDDVVPESPGRPGPRRQPPRPPPPRRPRSRRGGPARHCRRRRPGAGRSGSRGRPARSKRRLLRRE